MTALRAEVAIVGGGIVGATLALLLAQRARIDASHIVVIEPSSVAPPTAGAPFGLRVSAISPGNRALLTALGVWQQLDPGRISSYECMRVWHESVPPDSPDVLCFDAAEAGEPELGSIVENNALQAQLLHRCEEQGIRVLRESLRALQVDVDAARLDLGGTQITAELVAGADGAASSVRALLGMQAGQRDYAQRAIVATVRGERPHQHTAWQRFLSTGPLALLPLPGDECSIVWSAVNERADALRALAPAAFEAELTAASAGVLGRLRLTSERVAFPLRRLAAQDYVQPRAVLVGDAAHVIHPLAGQGVNQGFEDVVALAAALAQRPARESVGAMAALQRYARERRTGNALVAATVDSLDLLFTDSSALRSWAAREGMALVGRSPLARQFLVRRAAAGRSWPRR
jgi:ubiquinone biosynthesis UbiH/UbiF/VisC/COQ6 family hydroxylase